VTRASSRDKSSPESSKLSAAEELFDVVDEHDRVIDVLSRSEVHRRGLRHRAVHIFLFRSSGEMLIHLRHVDKEEFPSVWTSSASGHVSAGEFYKVSAERELFEELGVHTRLKKVGRIAACPDTSNEFTELFVADCDGALQVDETEISAVRWLPTSAIRTELAERPKQFSPAFRLLFAEYMASHHDMSDR
jgi:isopentenyl-diphosphate delta-isomerase